MRLVLLLLTLPGLGTCVEDPVGNFRGANTVLNDILEYPTFPPHEQIAWDRYVSVHPEDRATVHQVYARQRTTTISIFDTIDHEQFQIIEKGGMGAFDAYLNAHPELQAQISRAAQLLAESLLPMLGKAFADYQETLEAVRNSNKVGERAKTQVETLAKETEAKLAVLKSNFNGDLGNSGN